MKTAILLLATPLLAVAPSAADDLVLRYRELGSGLKIGMTHDIRAGASGTTRAGRTLAVELEVEAASGAADAAITSVRSTYTAHEMTARLANSHLVGQRFRLSIDAGRRSVEAATGGPALDLGGLPVEGLELGVALAGWLPQLPAGPVTVGSSWTTERTSHSLEGWAWASGSVTNRHTVLAIDRVDGRAIATVETRATARLRSADGGRAYGGSGALERTARWRFDATAGRLRSLSIEQRTEGTNALPQGDVKVRQITKVEISERR